MSVLETIKHRRSIGKMTAQRPERQQLQTILEAGTHAPNHHNVQPWRFFVLAGAAREELGKVMAESLATRLGETESPQSQALLAKEQGKFLRSPVIIIVISEHPDNSRVMEIENIEATAAAAQNMLLVADEMGLAGIWRTGEPAYDPRVKAWLGLKSEDHITGFLYLGYPAMDPGERHPIPAEEKTRWLGWDEAPE